MAEPVEVENGALELRRFSGRQRAQIHSGQQPIKGDSFLDILDSLLFGHRVPPWPSYAQMRQWRRPVIFDLNWGKGY
jgi:hypothetical protein